MLPQTPHNAMDYSKLVMMLVKILSSLLRPVQSKVDRSPGKRLKGTPTEMHSKVCGRDFAYLSRTTQVAPILLASIADASRPSAS